jgi:hypothetical protein
MKVKTGLLEVFRLFRTLLKFNNKSLLSRASTLIKNRNSKTEFKDTLLFLFGKRKSYLGLLLCEGKKVIHSLYLIINKGRVEEVGRVDLKTRNKSKAERELYNKLSVKGEVSKVFSYSRGGDFSLHP